MQSSDADTESTQSAMKAVVLTAQIGAATEEGKRVHPELERVSTLVQHVHKQLQQIPRGAEPDALRPIASVLGATLAAVRGMCSLRPNRHGYYYHALYSRELGHAERRLGQLVPILASQMARRPAETAAAAAMDHADQPAVFEIISDALARAFWRVAFGRNVVEVPIGQFFACIERMVDGGDWLNFACLSGALDQLRSGRVELAAFASFVEREGGLVRGLHKFATAPTMIYACGSNRMGECGQAAMVQDHIVSPAAVEVLADRTVRQIACDSGFSAAVLESGELYTWGSNSHGKLGQGEDDQRGSCSAPRLVQSLEGIPIDHVACGSTFMAAVARDGALYTWGGYSTHERHSPTLGHDPSSPAVHMGRDSVSGTPFLSVPLRVAALQELRVSQVSCGTEHAAALTDDGRVHCWGGGERGKLGLGNEEDSHIPQRVVALEDKTVCQLSCGTFHTLGVTTDGMVYAWGSGKDGKLGLGDVAYCPYFERDSSGQPFVSKPHLITALATRNTVVVQASAGSAHSAAVTASGVVYTFGCGKYGKLGHTGSGSEWLPKMVEAVRGCDATQVACGRDHTAVVGAEGLITWGHGERGRLGNGQSSGESKPFTVQGMRGRPLQVQCGRFHTLVLVGERAMREQDREQLTLMLEDRLGVRERETQTAVERYRTSTGKKRRRRRVVNRVGQEEYLSETETEQSELDLAPEVQEMIVQESELYLDKLEECEDLKEQVDHIQAMMQQMQTELQTLKAEKQAREQEEKRVDWDKIAAEASAAPQSKKVAGPAADAKVMKQGGLEKLSGGKIGKEKKKEKWQKRWFVLAEDIDLDGDGIPDLGLYYFKTEETYKQGKKPQGKVQLAGVQILVETKTDPKYLGGAEYQALRLTSPTHNILLRDDPDDGDDDVTDWIPPLEKIIEMQNQGRGMDSLQIGDEEDEDEDYHDGGAAAAADLTPAQGKADAAVKAPAALASPRQQAPGAAVSGAGAVASASAVPSGSDGLKTRLDEFYQEPLPD